jgi:hypothetical protein
MRDFLTQEKLTHPIDFSVLHSPLKKYSPYFSSLSRQLSQLKPQQTSGETERERKKEKERERGREREREKQRES